MVCEKYEVEEPTVCDINSNEERRKRCLRLFNSRHKFKPERLQIILNWVEYYNCISGIFSQTFENHITFLERVWDQDIFRPFDTVVSSENFLMMSFNCAYIIRLSSSQAGKITVSRKYHQNILHTRLSVITDGKLQESGGIIYEDIYALAVAMEKHLALQSRVYQPATYVQ